MMTVTKFINGPGCDLATGWDGAHLDGKHCTGHEMRVTVSRSMLDPRFVRYSSTVDGSEHVSGTVEPVERDGLDKTFTHIWANCYTAKAKYRETN